MENDLLHRNSLLRNPLEHLLKQLEALLLHVCLQVLPELGVLLHYSLDIKINELSIVLNLTLGNPLGVDNGLNLLGHIFRGKERLEGDQLGQQTPQTPNVYFLIILGGTEEDFRRSIPKSDDLICVLLCGETVIAGQSEVGYFDLHLPL